MKKLQSDYNHFLQEQQNGSNEDALSAPFQIKLDRLNRIVYNNFFHRISFLVLERKENMKDKERAGEIAIKLGIKKPLNN
ncbi:hypothetical protein M0Q03_02900 [bacterium]|jgi:hypothetical protein|nr:hypothetical protein [bacterium]